MVEFYQKLKYWKQISIIKTLCFNIRLGYLKNKQLIIYPKSKISISKTAHINLGNGHLVLNYSHFGKKGRTNFCQLILGQNSRLSLEKDNFSLCSGSSITIRDNAELIIKGKGFINTNSIIDCYSKIEIGYETIIAFNVTITDSDTHYILKKGVKGEKTKQIIIGNHVWIGMNSIILKGVEIGDNAVIAANTVVTKNVPPNSLFGGNPGKVIEEQINWEF